MLDIISLIFIPGNDQIGSITRYFNGLRAYSYNFYTGFPHNLWKTPKYRALFCLFSILLCCALVSSCTFFKSTKKATPQSQEVKTTEEGAKPKEGVKQKEETKTSKTMKPTLDNSLIDKNDEAVKKKFGEPTIVSRMPDNRIIWTYRPTWKLMPNNKDTVYIEFENGKVTKIVRGK
jgi:hypothetical protein